MRARERVDVVLAVLDRRDSPCATISATSSHSTIECCSAFDLVALASILRGRFAASSNAVAERCARCRGA